jgi:hypothetical protein
MNASLKPLQYAVTPYGRTEKINFSDRHFHIVEEELGRTEFYDKYKPRYLKMTDAINDGRIALHLKDGKVVINVREALQAIWPGCVIDEVSTETLKVDLF